MQGLFLYVGVSSIAGATYEHVPAISVHGTHAQFGFQLLS